MGDHSSRRAVARTLKQSTRTAGPEPVLEFLPCHPYSTLLPVGFAMPRPLPSARCALTAPFHLSPGRSLGRSLLCGTFPKPARGPIRRTLSGTVVSVEPGLSSPGGIPHRRRSPDPLARTLR
eukprot:Mycagemm_TRINITY_DN10265_c1_g1::TRINITY_DN10265_c1_g1_i1::g.3683::m.3683 type:complete len:122 gc:universal TRINITY_DN10265_c1_g1_i1:99-464(+)